MLSIHDINREIQNNPYIIPEQVSDGYHTFKELYEFRLIYNALLFNLWAEQGLYSVHKSWKHDDGNLCFGGGWFIVKAHLPAGQISNHYSEEHWDLFRIPEWEFCSTFDGHSAQEALKRLWNSVGKT
jgi:hypothetical protein